jgi:L-seryl-tRNA(Ser) seleniumtransferase
MLREVVHAAQQRARRGEIDPAEVADAAVADLPAAATSLRLVINATGVLVHTNLGRAPLSDAALYAVGVAGGTTDLEFDLATGRRGPRGAGLNDALARAVPDAGATLVVNNNAAALLLCALALAHDGEIVISRGELLEIGDGFRIPDLLASTGASLREVGTTNRVTRADYAAAIGPQTAFILKVHPSNFVVRGFTSVASVTELAGLGQRLVVDIGSGLLRPHPLLPDEPDATSALRAGADLVTTSADKLLGGPQAGLLLGEAGLVNRLSRHPAARALRIDKLTVAALEATLRGPTPPVIEALECGISNLQDRAEVLAAYATSLGLDAVVAASTATVGGGGAPDFGLPSAAVSLPAAVSARLRCGDPPVVGRVERGRCLLDLRTVPAAADGQLAAALAALVTAEP